MKSIRSREKKKARNPVPGSRVNTRCWTLQAAPISIFFFSFAFFRLLLAPACLLLLLLLLLGFLFTRLSHTTDDEHLLNQPDTLPLPLYLFQDIVNISSSSVRILIVFYSLSDRGTKRMYFIAMTNDKSRVIGESTWLSRGKILPISIRCDKIASILRYLVSFVRF